ncbi:MAG: hypothetical protein IJG97_06545 [Bacilli bacterium]|nr:hypothetical protein [Bacilli bacterium]
MNDFNTKLKEQIKKYSNKQYLDKYIQEEYLTEDGEADIFIKLTNKNQLFDERTFGNQLDLDSNIYEFVEEKSSMLDSSVQIRLNIVGLHLTKEEQNQVRDIIKEHYAIELYKIQKEYNKYRNEIFKLVLIGIFSLIFYGFLDLNTTLTFFMEVMCFIFSFALWQAFENIIYDFRDVKETRKDITQNLLMNVTFDEKEKDIND